jgi:hypothetical protein
MSNDKSIVRKEDYYKVFLTSCFEVLPLEAQEEFLFGGSDEAIDSYLEEFPDEYEDLDIERDRPDPMDIYHDYD